MLYVLSQDDEQKPAAVDYHLSSSNQKEANFLRYNEDGIYGNLLATEEHFRNLKGNADFNQCAVKHLALATNHADEAVSHTIAVGDSNSSKEYARIRDDMRSLQHDVQDGKVNSEEGIKRIREIKHEFEAINPSYDVSKCKACTI